MWYKIRNARTFIFDDNFFNCDVCKIYKDAESTDTLFIYSRDTIYQHSNYKLLVYDTVVTFDTRIVAADTLVVYDTTYMVKTVVMKDTQYLSVDTLTLINQKVLNLSGVSLSGDLHFFEGMNQLECLLATGTQNTNLIPWSNLTNVKYLYLAHSDVEDVNVLKPLSKL